MTLLKEWIENNLITQTGRISSFAKNKLEKEGKLTEVLDLAKELNNSSLGMKLAFILLDLNVPRCPCGSVIKLTSPLKGNYKEGTLKLTSKKYCSYKCSGSNSDVLETRKLTNNIKYGGNSPSSSKEIREKIKRTTLINLGVECSFQSEKVKKKIKEKILKNNEGMGAASFSIRQKMEETNLKKFGFKNPFESNEIQNKIKDKLKKEYGVYNINQKDIPKDSLIKLQDSKYLLESNKSLNCIEIAQELKVAPSTVIKSFKRLGLIPNKHKISLQEKEVFNFIQELLPNTFILKSDKIILNNKELDIYIPEYKLAIEYNGIYWHSDSNKPNRNYHLNKTNLCEQKGIQLIHLFSNEWEQKKEIVQSILRSKLNKLEITIFARKCEIREVQNLEAKEFLNNNHLQGFKNSKVKLGLYFNNELVSLMTFSKRQKRYDWELDRFCNKLNTKVIGSASKLFKNFIKLFPNESILTYADRRYSNGSLYLTLGFELKKVSPPNYWYTKDYNKLLSRLKYQKHKLSKLEFFDINKSEIENMEENGFDRIWDCGNLVYIYNIEE